MSMETIRDLAWTDYFLFAVVDPRELYRRIKQHEYGIFQLSFVVPAFVAFGDILATALSGGQSNFFYYKLSYGWLLIFLLMILRISVYSSLIDSSSQFFGKSGNIRDVLTLVNFSLFPKMFFLPVFYMITITDFMAVFFYILLSLVFFCWSIYILVQGISEMHSVTFGRALVILIMPAALIWVLLLFTTITLVIMLAGYITG